MINNTFQLMISKTNIPLILSTLFKSKIAAAMFFENQLSRYHLITMIHHALPVHTVTKRESMMLLVQIYVIHVYSRSNVFPFQMNISTLTVCLLKMKQVICRKNISDISLRITKKFKSIIFMLCYFNGLQIWTTSIFEIS